MKAPSRCGLVAVGLDEVTRFVLETEPLGLPSHEVREQVSVVVEDPFDRLRGMTHPGSCGTLR